jgi:hypothetical protein
MFDALRDAHRARLETHEDAVEYEADLVVTAAMRGGDISTAGLERALLKVDADRAITAAIERAAVRQVAVDARLEREHQAREARASERADADRRARERQAVEDQRAAFDARARPLLERALLVRRGLVPITETTRTELRALLDHELVTVTQIDEIERTLAYVATNRTEKENAL